MASPDDFDAVRRIAMDVGNARDPDGYVPVICGLSRTKLRQAALHQSPLNLVLACHRLLLNCFSTLANTPNWSPHACAVFPFSWPASFFPSCHLYALPRRQLRMQSILLYQQNGIRPHLASASHEGITGCHSSSLCQSSKIFHLPRMFTSGTDKMSLASARACFLARMLGLPTVAFLLSELT